VGPYEACPYCGARQTGRIPIRAIKIAAILLVTIGLAVLWLAAVHAEVPLIQIGQAGATMNMAYVRLQGYCTRAPTYDPEGDYLSFWIEDETGAIRVSSYRAETREIIDHSLVPALGDLVEVAGTLRVREDYLALTINVPDQLQITRAEPVEREISSIGLEDEYLRVRVAGEVRVVYEPYEGLTLIDVRDETGTIPVAVSEDLVALSGAVPALFKGQAVQVVGAVSLYGDMPQLVPASVADIVPLEERVQIAAEKLIGQLTTADLGQLVAVRGIVTNLELFSSGVKATLDDDSGEVVVLLWQDVYDGLPDPAALDVGAEVRVQGEVSQYRGALELIPELAEDVRVLAAAPLPSAATVGSLTSSDVGRVVTLRGVLGEPDPFSAGVKFELDDGTGKIVLLLWSDVYEGAPSGLAGAWVEVTGEIEEYRDEMEIVPRNVGEIVLLEDVPSSPVGEPAPAAEARAIGDITSADVGQTLLLVGVLGEPETFSSGVKFALDDGSGTIVLLLWDNIYQALPDAERLVVGARAEVVGRIDEYQGELEVIPEADGVRVVE
jgi:DNA/RNA endonuclease YhcR with UshA esterase domain